MSRRSSGQGSSSSLASEGSARHGSTSWNPESHYVSYQEHGSRGPRLAPISSSRSPHRRSSCSRSPENGTSRPHRSPDSSSGGPTPNSHSPAPEGFAHSYDLFDYSPDQGLVHKRTSKSQEDLDESKPKTRTTSVTDISRRYVCSQCGKRFAKPSTLRNHTMTHTGEKPFACPHPGCGRPFSMASNMQRHMRTHTSGSAFRNIPDGEEEDELSSGRASTEELNFGL